MRGRFHPREAFALYSLLVVLLACFFIAGLYIGRNRGEEQKEVKAGETEPSEEPLGSDEIASTVDFYDNLSAPPPSVPTMKESSPEVIIESAEGTAPPVQTAVEPPAPAAPRSATPESPPEKAASPVYTIQVAAHSTEAEAQQTLLRLSAKNFEGRINRPIEGTEDPYFRVWVGSFDSAEAARGLEAELKSKGFYTYVRRTN